MKTNKDDIVVVNASDEATLYRVTKVDGFAVTIQELHPDKIYKEQVVDVSMLKKPKPKQMYWHIIRNSK